MPDPRTDLARGSWPGRGQAIGDVERWRSAAAAFALRETHVSDCAAAWWRVRMEAKVALGRVVERANHGSDDAKRQTR